MAAAAVSLACPLRRSTRLAHAHAHTKHPRPLHRPRQTPAPTPDPDHDHDSSSSSDPENELTPRALRALKRQRLALDLDGLPFSVRTRPRKRRREAPAVVSIDTHALTCSHKRPSSPPRSPLTPSRTQATDGQAHPLAFFSTDSCHSLHSTATTIPPPRPEPATSELGSENRPPCSLKDTLSVTNKPELSIPLLPIFADPSTDPSTSPSPLTPLTPLTPSPESSPSLPGHDRQVLPPQDPLPPPDALPIPCPEPNQPPDSFAPPPSISLDPALDTLIPFEGLHPPFDPEMAPSSCQPPTPPGLELQEQFHSFPPPQLYVPPNPVFVRDREINIWKLACQERVDCLLRRYGIDYIKALVESEARSVAQETSLSPTPQTKFRLYTPASYTYSSTSWGSTSGTRKAFPVDDGDDLDPAWPMEDGDWVDADVDMEDEDEDDYEDDDEPAEAERDGEATLGAVEGLAISDTPSQVATAMQVDDALDKSDMMQVDGATRPTVVSEAPVSSRLAPSTTDLSLRPLTPHSYSPPPPVKPPGLPLLSSLHVPLLSEPPRAFMGRGTPPDRRRLIEWSGSGRFAINGMGPPLYLSPVPQRHDSAEVGIVPMSVDAPIHPPSPHHHPHTHGEWTSFLYSMLEGDGVGTGVGDASHASESTWYELGLGSVPAVGPENTLELPLAHPHPHTHGRTPTVEQPVEEGNNSSSTLRFALG